MSIPNAEQVLRVWEQGLGAGSLERALLILRELGSGLCDIPPHEMTVGECDRALFVVRCRLFGEQFAATVVCAGCRGRLQIEFELRDVLAGSAPEPQKHIECHLPDDVSVALRVPRVADMTRAAGAQDASDAQRLLLQRCVESVHVLGKAVQIGELPASTLAEIDARLEQADPDANLVLQAHCPTCNSAADHRFDIGHFLWTEIETEAIRLLREVHQLARGYGWHESDILAMTPPRRQAYLEMLPA